MSDIDIGQLSEAINDKADRDLNNTQPLARVVVEVSSRDILPSWYRVYSDGWCEQGGYSVGASGGASISLLKQFTDTNYNISYMPFQTSNTDLSSYVQIKSKAVSGFFARTVASGGSNSSQFTWQASGYIN